MTAPPRQIAALSAVAAALERAGARWVVTGSLGRALLGCDVRPRDVDLEVDPDRADAAAAALGVVLEAVEGGGRRSRRGGRHLAGVEVDMTSGFAIDAPGVALAPDFARMWEWSRPVTVAGRAVRVAPPEEALCRAAALGDWARIATVAGQAATAPGLRLSAAYVAERLASASSSAAR